MDTNVKYVDMETSKKYSFWKGANTYCREYTEISGIHGLRYLTEKRTVFEKILWGLLLLISLAGCTLMIYQIVERYKNSPIVVSFATKDTPLFSIPFPAVTICPESKCLEDHFNYSDAYNKIFHSNTRLNSTEMRNFYYISLLCNSFEQNAFFTYVYNTAFQVENDFSDIINELRPDELISCSFMGDDCLDHLYIVLTDQGICYSFNIVDQEDMFRSDVIYYKPYRNLTAKPVSYNSDTGYAKDAGINAYPKRALLSGADDSLNIELAHERYTTDLLCNKNNQGYKVLLHNPLEFPRLSKSYFRVPLQKTVAAMVEPALIATTPAVKNFNPDSRNCYLENERPLLYFKPYTQLNCLLECEANFTLMICGCVTYYMPNDNYMKDYLTMINTTALLGLENYYYSSLFVYFKSDQFTAIERNELYGPSDLVANFGGLLGLFTGFSLISGVEIIYFITVRIYYNIQLYGNWLPAEFQPPNFDKLLWDEIRTRRQVSTESVGIFIAQMDNLFSGFNRLIPEEVKVNVVTPANSVEALCGLCKQLERCKYTADDCQGYPNSSSKRFEPDLACCMSSSQKSRGQPKVSMVETKSSHSRSKCDKTVHRLSIIRLLRALHATDARNPAIPLFIPIHILIYSLLRVRLVWETRKGPGKWSLPRSILI
ncbi:pickpocket protein 28-like [Zophobas morio]|uniref:pickpocket protein 28-like n=1 Tax=Zophobas morio TaxID=2755281 RepID=UPI003083DB7E